MLKRILSTLKYYDWWLLVFCFILLTIGIIIIYSIGVNTSPTDLSRFYKQIIFAIIGIVIMICISYMDYRILNNYATIFYLVGGFLLLAVLFFGTTISGTTGWFILGFFSFQPVEVAKICLLAFLARFFSINFSMDKVQNIVLSAIFAGIFILLVLKQPDLGSALIFISLWIGFLLLSRVKKSQLLIIFALMIIVAVSSWFLVLKDYQKQRIITFINPASDSLKRGYNVMQAKISVGSGKIIGRGLGLGSQSQLNFLPEQDADFIFAVIAEELGLIGSGLVIILFGMIFYRIWKLLKHAQDDFTQYLVSGILIMLFTQTTINIGMNIGLMPVTGLPLPWISAGGTSLVINLALIGILQSIYKRQNLT